MIYSDVDDIDDDSSVVVLRDVKSVLKASPRSSPRPKSKTPEPPKPSKSPLEVTKQKSPSPQPPRPLSKSPLEPLSTVKSPLDMVDSRTIKSPLEPLQPQPPLSRPLESPIEDLTPPRSPKILGSISSASRKLPRKSGSYDDYEDDFLSEISDDDDLDIKTANRFVSYYDNVCDLRCLMSS